jgi:hypothetical protein
VWRRLNNLSHLNWEIRKHASVEPKEGHRTVVDSIWTELDAVLRSLELAQSVDTPNALKANVTL